MNFLLTSYARTVQSIRRLRRMKKLPKRQLYPARRAEEALHAFPAKKPLIICREGYTALAENYARLLALGEKSSVVWNHYSHQPTPEDTENARLVYVGQSCDGILVIGDGALIDEAKLLSLRIRHPDKKQTDRSARRTGKRRIPLLAIPTAITAGQESIAGFTMGKKKVRDKKLLPLAVIYAPQLFERSRPEILTDRTVEALSRALDLSLSRRVKKTDQIQIAAIFRELLSLIRDRTAADTPELREQIHGLHQQLLLLSNRYPDGYIIALSRELSARQNLPLSACQAALLPQIPQLYGKKLDKKLPSLCSVFDFPSLAFDSPADARQAFLQALPSVVEQALAPCDGGNTETDASPLTLQGCRLRKLSRKLAHRVNPGCVAPAVLGRRDIRRCLHTIFPR